MSKVDQIGSISQRAFELAELAGEVLPVGEGENILDEIRALELRGQVSIFAELRQMKDDLDGAKKLVNKVLDIVGQDIIPGRMDEDGVENVAYEGIGKVVLQGDIFASIKADNKQQAYEWLDDNGHGDLITATVNSSSLKALLRKLLKDGDEIPEDLFNVTPYTRTTLRKG